MLGPELLALVSWRRGRPRKPAQGAWSGHSLLQGAVSGEQAQEPWRVLLLGSTRAFSETLEGSARGPVPKSPWLPPVLTHARPQQTASSYRDSGCDRLCLVRPRGDPAGPARTRPLLRAPLCWERTTSSGSQGEAWGIDATAQGREEKAEPWTGLTAAWEFCITMETSARQGASWEAVGGCETLEGQSLVPREGALPTNVPFTWQLSEPVLCGPRWR